MFIEHGRVLLARQRDTGRWSLIGGGIEPGEEPRDAVAREVREELGVEPLVGPIIGAYGGPGLRTVLPNQDEVSYVTVAYRCRLPEETMTLEAAELLEIGWFPLEVVPTLDRHSWIDRVVTDAQRS